MKRIVCASGLAIIGTMIAVHQPMRAAVAREVSGQCQWDVDGVTTHTHIHTTNDHRYQQVNGPFTFPFAVKLFHTPAGTKIIGYGGEQNADVQWDETRSSAFPDLQGDPHGLKTWTGHVTEDPRLGGDRAAPPHGVYYARQMARTLYPNNKGQVDTELWEQYYSMLDPSQPEVAISPSSGYLLNAKCQVASPAGNQFGSTIVEFREPLPQGVLTAPFTTEINAYNYGDPPTGLPQGTFEQWLDRDIHNGVTGTLLATNTAMHGVTRMITIDPAQMGTGFHRQSFAWIQPGNGGEQISAWIVMDFEVGDGIVVPPPPPPPVVNPPLPPIAGVYTFTCDAAGNCKLVILR
jgi:hypothetical protein